MSSVFWWIAEALGFDLRYKTWRTERLVEKKFTQFYEYPIR
jgi:hypothetical protein